MWGNAASQRLRTVWVGRKHLPKSSKPYGGAVSAQAISSGWLMITQGERHILLRKRDVVTKKCPTGYAGK